MPDGGEPVATQALGGGLFAAFVAGRSIGRSTTACASASATVDVWERGDPYRFLPTLGDIDLHLFNEGNHRRLWERLGARVSTSTACAAWRSRSGRRTRGA